MVASDQKDAENTDDGEQCSTYDVADLVNRVMKLGLCNDECFDERNLLTRQLFTKLEIVRQHYEKRIAKIFRANEILSARYQADSQIVLELLRLVNKLPEESKTPVDCLNNSDY